MKIIYEEKEANHHSQGMLKLINNSPQTLQNICLDFEDSALPYEYTVVRERGSLTFSSLQEGIPLGNLYPEEIAYLYYEPKHSDIRLNATLLDHIKISYQPENQDTFCSIVSELIK